LFILEVKITSYGLLGIGGVISMLLGSLLLIDSAAAPWLKISLSVIVITVGSISAFFIFMIVFVLKAHRRKPTTGREALVGAVGDVRPGGMVFLEGELWRAECDEPLEKGDRVKVMSVENMKIKVQKVGR
jgi:membrane-bound serine protease (ClpP class)